MNTDKPSRAMLRVLRLIAEDAPRWNANADTIQGIVDRGLAVYVDWEGWRLTDAGRAALRSRR